MAANVPLNEGILAAMEQASEVIQATEVMSAIIEAEDDDSGLKTKAANMAAEDNDSVMAVCGDEDVANLLEEMADQVEAAAENDQLQPEDAPVAEPVPTYAAVVALKRAGFEPEENEPEDAVVAPNGPKPDDAKPCPCPCHKASTEAEPMEAVMAPNELEPEGAVVAPNAPKQEEAVVPPNETAPRVIVEYLIAVDAAPIDMPGLNKILVESFGPKHTSTPKKEAEPRPGTPMPTPEEEDNSRDSFYDDEEFARRLTEPDNLVILLKPLEGKVLDDWKPAKQSFFAVLASAVHVGRCRDRCFTLETTSFIVERRDISGAEKQCLRAVLLKTAERLMSFDLAHPVPTSGFRAHLICKLIDGAIEETVVGTVHNASRATFVDDLLDKFYRAARSQNVDWHRIFSESGLHLFVDVSRATNGHHVQHPLVRPATRARIDLATTARQDLLRSGKQLQSDWHFDVYGEYGVVAPDGRKL